MVEYKSDIKVYDRLIGFGEGSSSSFEESGSPIWDILRRLGLAMERKWLASCITRLQSLVLDFRNLPVREQAELCFREFLYSDMNTSVSVGVLPENVNDYICNKSTTPFFLCIAG